MRTSLEVADIFRSAGPAYRVAHAGHMSLGQFKVMTAIENCRTAALGGHVEACDDCGHWRIAYNSCRNRHCPKCQGAAARTWLAAREADLLPVGYFHVVFTVPAEIADIAWQNQAVVYALLFRAAADTMLTIAADPKHLGARIGITAVLHTWGSALTHHPHVHMIVPGGGIALDGTLVAGTSSELTLTVSRDGRPVTDLQPYLGAYGHLVALRDGDLAYLHVHPDGELGDAGTRPGPDVTFHADVPAAATYRLFLDFQHAGVVRTAELTAVAKPAGGSR